MEGESERGATDRRQKREHQIRRRFVKRLIVRSEMRKRIGERQMERESENKGEIAKQKQRGSSHSTPQISHIVLSSLVVLCWNNQQLI